MTRRSRYRVTLSGEPLAAGTLQEAQQAAMQAITGLLAQDPEGVAPGAQQANSAFQQGAVQRAVDDHGEWKCPLWVHGQAHTLRVTRGA